MLVRNGDGRQAGPNGSPTSYNILNYQGVSRRCQSYDVYFLLSIFNATEVELRSEG